jgi:hypothetical protein
LFDGYAAILACFFNSQICYLKIAIYNDRPHGVILIDHPGHAG